MQNDFVSQRNPILINNGSNLLKIAYNLIHNYTKKNKTDDQISISDNMEQQTQQSINSNILEMAFKLIQKFNVGEKGMVDTSATSNTQPDIATEPQDTDKNSNLSNVLKFSYNIMKQFKNRDNKYTVEEQEDTTRINVSDTTQQSPDTTEPSPDTTEPMQDTTEPMQDTNKDEQCSPDNSNLNSVLIGTQTSYNEQNNSTEKYCVYYNIETGKVSQKKSDSI